MQGDKKDCGKKEPKKRIRLSESLRSVRFTVWIYFAIFIVSILILMWITFIATFETNFRMRKNSDIEKVSNAIVSALESGSLTKRTISTLGHDYDMCIVLQDRYGLNLYSYDIMSDNCLIHGGSEQELSEYRRQARESKDHVYMTEAGNSFSVNTLLYVRALGRTETVAYLMINTSLEPLDSTEQLLREQMMQLSIFILILGFGISVFLSRLLSTPITRITRSAEKLAQGDFNVEFNGNGYTETEKLADTLNYASCEITKIDTMRRDLMANISHDLRTPLTMVKAYAEMIRDLSGDNPEKRNEHLEIIIEESDRLAALVNDIMDLTKLESGASALNLENILLSERISQIMNRYAVISERDGYSFYVSVPDDIRINVDPIKFDQVIYNLVNNAVNYSGDSREIYVCAIVSGENVEISVTDTGDGIPEDQLGVIFDRYYRAEKHKRDKIGTGLGLSIVKQILIMHGFDFGVRSEEKVGSTFWFRTKMLRS